MVMNEMADSFQILILGGYGNAGRKIAGLLYQNIKASGAHRFQNIRIFIAGRNLSLASDLSGMLNGKNSTEVFNPIQVDINDKVRIQKALQNMNMVLVCLPLGKAAKNIIEVAIECGVDFFDISISTDKKSILHEYKPIIEKRGLCFMVDGGYHPGIPGALARYAAGFFDQVESIIVGALMNIDWKSYTFSPETITEFVSEIRTSQAMIYANGQWNKTRFGGTFDMLALDFDNTRRNQSLAPMYLEEMKDFTDDYPSIRRTGFYIGGMDWFSNLISFPLAITWYMVFPKSNPGWLAKLIFWGMKRYSSPPYNNILIADAKGFKNGKAKRCKIFLEHEDGYLFTAIPVIATLNQYFEKRKAGIWRQATFVEPVRFIQDIQDMGIRLKTEEFES